MYLAKQLVEDAPVDGEEWEERGWELGGASVVQKQRNVMCVSLSGSILKRTGYLGSAADRNQINVAEKLYDSSLPAVLPP